MEISPIRKLQKTSAIDQDGNLVTTPRLSSVAGAQPAEHEQRLTDGTRGSLHEYALASVHPCCAVEQLVRGHLAQDQRGRLCRVEARGYADQAVGPERAIGGV
jgi:hypothetical protein